MNDILSTIMNTFATMQPREKLFLKAGGAVNIGCLVGIAFTTQYRKVSTIK